MSVYTFGLSEILVGNVLETGLMPALNTLTKLGEVLEGTATMTQEAGDRTEFREEGVITPKVVIQKAGSWSWNFNIMNADPAMLASYLGGTVTNGVWNYLGETVNIEKAIMIKPKQGLYWQLPKAAISAVISGDFNEDGLVTLNFTVSPLSPGNAKPSILSGKVTDLTPVG